MAKFKVNGFIMNEHSEIITLSQTVECELYESAIGMAVAQHARRHQEARIEAGNPPHYVVYGNTSVERVSSSPDAPKVPETLKKAVQRVHARTRRKEAVTSLRRMCALARRSLEAQASDNDAVSDWGNGYQMGKRAAVENALWHLSRMEEVLSTLPKDEG